MVNDSELRKETFDDAEGLEVLPDYEGFGAESDEGEGGKKGLAVRSSGFKEFMLNKEVYRAVVENGFEHPSEGTPVYTHAVADPCLQCSTSVSPRRC